MDQLTIQERFDLAIQHHQVGQLRQAEQLYRQILAVQPNHADALHLLGMIAYQVGRNDIAVDLIRRAIAINPNHVEAHNNLGITLAGSGQPDEAIVAFRQAIALKPDYAEAYNNLGIVLADKRQHDEAIAAYRRAIALNPKYAEAHNNLGVALSDKGQHDEAIAAFRRAIALKPDYAEAHNNLGNTLKDIGRLDEAIASCRRAIALKPDYAEAHNNLGNALKDKGQLDEAVAAYRRAIVLKPDYTEAHYNLGVAHNNLGIDLGRKGQLDEAIAAFRQAVVLSPDYADARHNLLYTLHFHPAYDAPAIAEEHRRWNDEVAEPLRKFTRPFLNDRTPDRRLRIGYVSGDFRQHSVSFFIESILAHHDHGDFEIFCYSDVRQADVVTRRLQGQVDVWRDIADFSDGQLADLIQSDRIDILIDLSGHTTQNRLLTFARKPAPVQVTYLGYPGSTGLKAMDYRITDAHADPPGTSEQFQNEKLIRLDSGFLCYQPYPQSPQPQNRDGPIVFGSFNNWAKINPQVLELWTNVLLAVPASNLLIKAAALGNETMRQQVRRQFAELGIDARRLQLMGRISDQIAHLDLYNQVDIALDSFPYNGATTTCEALWMGVPVITLAGKAHAGRVGVSLLNMIGLPDLIADTPQHYIQIAADLAWNPLRRAELRQSLRPRMTASPLMDAPNFTRKIEAAYQQMWRTWCETGTAGS